MIPGVIPVAGRGSRAFPKTSGLPKVLLEVGGKTLLERKLLRDQLNVREIYLIVGHLQAQIRAGVMRGAEAERIRRNYSVEVKADRIVALEEKPVDPPNDLLGCGTFVLTPEIFDAIDATPPSSRTGRVELIAMRPLLRANGPDLSPETMAAALRGLGWR
jgi:NDP-sugar pyrophosphorylase family protein